MEELATELDRLATEAGDAAPRFQALAERLRAVSDNQALIDQFARLKRETSAAGDAMEAAQSKVDAVAREMKAAVAPSAQLSASFERAKGEARDAKTAYDSSSAALASLRKQLAAAQISTADLAEHDVALRAAVQEVSDEVAHLGASMDRGRQSAERFGVKLNDAVGPEQAAAAKRTAVGVSEIGEQLRSLTQLAASIVGINIGSDLVRDLGATADAYDNLSARVRIAVGENGNFQEAMSGVQQVALRTNSSLEGTGDLFARIVQAGQSLGVTTSEALGLTETINQAIQLSGASADASDAAIRQLIQGLQSGVLRGDEFNSVMEQSPRLAKALADGLNVTTGELRTMAAAGALTTSTIIESLRGQANAVESEFGKLPPTIGRAITNLSTQWMGFVGEVNQAGGVSESAAKLINLLANNLGNVAGALIDLGQGWLAFKAYNIAAEFISIRAAVDQGAAAKLRDVAATEASTVATAANTTALRANAAAQVANMRQGGAVTAGLDVATVAAGRFGAALSLIKGFTFATLLVNLPDIGKWLGEATAKALGYGKAMEDNELRVRADEEATRQLAKANAELAAKHKLAQEQALGLSDASRQLINDFTESQKKGEAVAESIEKLSKALQLGDISGISTAGAALDALARKGQLSAEQVRAAWAKALSTQDLQVFETNARAAFDGTDQGLRRLQSALDGAFAESVRRTGVSLGELSNGVSDGAQSAINNIDFLADRVGELEARGLDVNKALSAGLSKATEAADTERAVEQVIRRWEELGKQGLVTGDNLTKGLERARAKLDELTPGVNTVAEAFKTLGVKSSEELQRTARSYEDAFNLIKSSGTASVEQQRQAFQKYAAAAIEANSGVASSTIQVQATMLGLEVKTDAAGKSVITAMSSGASAADGLASSLSRAADQSDRLNTSIQQRGSGSDTFKGGLQGLTNIKDLPQGLTLQQLQDKGLSSREIEDYQLNSGPNQVPGQVNRYVNTQVIDAANVARENGLRGADVKAFSEIFDDILADSMADMRANLQGKLINNSDYTDAYAGYFGLAVNKAIEQVQVNRSSRSDDGSKTTVSKRVRVDLNIGGTTVPVETDEDQADQLMTALERAQKVAA